VDHTDDTDILGWRPRLRDGLVAEHRGRELLFVCNSDARAARFTATDTVLRLVPLLTGEHTVAELIARLCPDSERGVVELCTALLTLRDERLLSRVADPIAEHGALTPAEVVHYDRQLRLFQEFCDAGVVDGDRGHVFQERLKAASVVVCGAGGLGSAVTASLVAAGVGEVVVCDDDTVEEHNLHRQYTYGRSDIGRRKVEVLAERLADGNPHVSVVPVARRLEDPAALAALATAADLVVSCADQPSVTEMAALVTEACWPRTPHLIGGAYAYYTGLLGLTVVPGVTACWDCLLLTAVEAFDRTGMHSLKPKPRYTGAIGVQAGIGGNVMAWEAIRFLAGMPIALADQWTELDYWTMRVRTQPVPRRPDCPRCGSTAVVPTGTGTTAPGGVHPPRP
jgi:bacteriocin biosynthesis cyclodehydratase domain-containing protein